MLELWYLGVALKILMNLELAARVVRGNCESFAEKSRSEQMKWLQIAMTESYTWNLGRGLFYLSTHEVTKGVGGKGGKKSTKKSTLYKRKEIKKIQSKVW